MSLYDVLDQIIVLLRQRKRLTYRLLQREFSLDDETLKDLKDELIKAQRVAVDEEDSILVWRGEAGEAPASVAPLDRPEQQPIAVEEPSPQVEPPPPEPHRPDAERRQLTVMFCDLVGSTSLSGALDPEDYRAVVREYQKACTEVIERYDGYVAQYLGDGLLVYFGYPQSHEDEAQRAVYTGLGILRAMEQLNARLESDKDIHLGVRVGIHTGLVVIGEIGEGSRQEQLALGEVPNVSARIQGLAAPDTVVISDATHRLIQGYFECQELGEQSLRGVAELVTVYRVLQESGVQSRLDVAGARGLTPLVGRQQEVGLLLERWEQVKDGQGQIVLLSGEAGIGKSRLVQVLKEHVTEESPVRLECRSSPYYQNTALYPITDLLQRILRWHQDDTPEERLEKLEQELSQYRLPLAESIPLFAPLLSLPVPEDRCPPLNLTPQRQRQKTLETVVAMLLDLAEQQPVLFILEDLHWTDPSTIELLGLLTEQTPTSRLYALLTCRPEFESPFGNRSYLTQMTLNRLSHDDVEQMVERVTDGKSLPDEIVQQLVDKTDGVPLYVEEMTKAILESGVLKETNEQYELSGSISTLSIPATLQDSLMARLDRLVTAKAIAQYASVIGRQFSYELLHAASQVDEGTLRKELSRLVEAELVYQRGLPPQAMYTFKHALAQDTAYESLLRSTRQGYHRRIAEVLEERFPDTTAVQPELLAHHFTEAGFYEEAVDYWQQAGEKAMQRSANVEAISHFSTGLDLLSFLPDTPERTQRELTLHVNLGAPLMVTKGWSSPEVEKTFTRARTLCLKVGDTPQLFPTLRGLWRFYQIGGDLRTANELAEQCFSLAERLQEPGIVIEAHLVMGITLYHIGDIRPAHEHFMRGFDLYHPEEHHGLAYLYGEDPGVACLSRAANMIWLLGYPNQAMTIKQESLHLAQKLSHPFSLGYAMSFAVVLYRCLREWRMLQELVESMISLSTQHGFLHWLSIGRGNQGLALAMLGATQEGISQIRQQMAVKQSMQEGIGQPFRLAGLAEVFGRIGHVEEGLSLLAEALILMETTGERLYEAEIHRLKGELLLQQSSDSVTAAETCFQQAISIAQHQSAKSWELRAATSLAKLWQSQDKRQDAYDLLAPVYSWFTEGFDTADLQDAKNLLDKLEG